MLYNIMITRSCTRILTTHSHSHTAQPHTRVHILTHRHTQTLAQTRRCFHVQRNNQQPHKHTLAFRTGERQAHSTSDVSTTEQKESSSTHFSASSSSSSPSSSSSSAAAAAVASSASTTEIDNRGAIDTATVDAAAAAVESPTKSPADRRPGGFGTPDDDDDVEEVDDDELIELMTKYDNTDIEVYDPTNIEHQYHDPTMYSENLEDINERLRWGKPLLVNQQIVLLQFMLDKLNDNPRMGFGVNPLISWTHPKDQESRVDRHPPRMEEKFVPHPHDPAIVKSMSIKGPRSRPLRHLTEYQYGRAAYEAKVHVVRKQYQAELAAVKARRERQIMADWKATKAAAKRRREQKLALVDPQAEEKRKQQDQREFEKRVKARLPAVAARLKFQHKQQLRKAGMLESLIAERQKSWINLRARPTINAQTKQQEQPSSQHGASATWGRPIDESLFHTRAKAPIGFWPRARRLTATMPGIGH